MFFNDEVKIILIYISSMVAYVGIAYILGSALLGEFI